jgi:hypothetical protein
MKRNIQPFETKGHDLAGNASLEFHENESLQSFVSLIPGLDFTRFEPVALKIFVSGDVPLIILYARRIEPSFSDMGTVLVRKFKVPVTWNDLFRFVKSFDLIVHNGTINFEDMEMDRK